MIKIRTFIASFLLLGLLVLEGNHAEAQAPVPYQTQVEAGPDENFDYAAVQLWMPVSQERVRGILCVVLHPLGQGASTLAHPEPWIELAQEEKCALMSISFAQSEDLTRNWSQAEHGTGRALLESISNISRQSGVSTLSTCPIIPVGVCAAGQFAFHLAALAPDRVVSFVTIGGGKHDLSKGRGAATLPGLLIMTPDRGPVAAQNLQSLYEEGQRLSAPWQLASEPISKYDAGFCSSRVISYLRQRLATLGNPAQVGARTDSHEVSNADDWLPISICGIKLPPQITVEPSTASLGTINSSSSIQTQSFTLKTPPNSSVDSVFVRTSSEAIKTTVHKEGPHDWRLECCLDPATLPLGPCTLLVKIRLLAGNKQQLGGDHLTLSGSISGPVNWLPHSLNFGSVGPGQTATASVEISSDTGAAIQVKDVTSPYPWIQAVEHIRAGRTIIECVLKAPSTGQEKDFAGYLEVNLQAPMRRSIKILCYGSVNKS